MLLQANCMLESPFADALENKSNSRGRPAGLCARIATKGAGLHRAIWSEFSRQVDQDLTLSAV